MNHRSVARLVQAEATTEGAGFQINRPFPTRALGEIDPFLLFDEMGPMDVGPGEAKGAPDHPHRGFETISYVLSGEMVHTDSHGNVGVIGGGDVQWMTAGAGVIHSEMPGEAIMRQGGRMHGFQIWVNLPASDKMTAQRYQDIAAADIPTFASSDGKTRVRVIAGSTNGVRGAVETHTPIHYLHATLAPGAVWTHDVPAAMNAMAYVIDGAVRIERTEGRRGQLFVFGRDGDGIEVHNTGTTDAEILFLAGEPIGEPIARYGPFVMNTREELVQAFEDYNAGRFGVIA